MNSIDYFDGGGSKNRTHTVITHEFTVKDVGVTIGMLIDNKTKDMGITISISPGGIGLGKTILKMEWDFQASGAITDSISLQPVDTSVDFFAGAGLAVQGSYDIESGSWQRTISALEGEKRGVAGVGFEAGVSASRGVDINLSHYFREVGAILEKYLKELDKLVKDTEGLLASFAREDSSLIDSEYHAFQSREREYHLINFEKQGPIGQLSNESLVKDSVLP